VVQGAHASGGKRSGTAGHHRGRVPRKGAFSEAAASSLVENPPGQHDSGRLEHKDGPGKAVTVVAHKRARAVDSLVQRHTTFDLDRVLQGEGRARGAPGELAGAPRTGRRAGRAPGFPAPGAGCGGARRRLGPRQATIGRACAAPPPRLPLTGEPSTFSLGLAEDGMRAPRNV
jgi:hypothetical protein